ncbi:ABC transporter [Nostoc linckia z18]|uniref:ABC transporter n=2 Tax=Nostoc linckia TaxID=92942 RepID=A0A9Q5ZFW1_NOSLI|nr:ABC transporter [Nostoc linckia z3]PHJ75966.1 ABC transporter [Nostoc linckia z2]PHJ85847.1 ABC transporter [Nostoc linckia z4]PHJ88849.1 ABC transporter [Nostoc linckia z6]PHK00787.1 ABC transporter [Nostoc linckia z7]PHK02061.1 ABC transporter [Nostoc linckia z13]PHK06656.1 ABC transporter [Nostoc linckia z8]PHK10554.1 ABC transporter [Nostoc linckia z9]PHK20978.1 ABC transporter [Nostoc linckia z14]PHK25150.1 ABC transporter [Nostoc linckia z16]PHK35040.1 ABC transporter [Nostoc lin
MIEQLRRRTPLGWLQLSHEKSRLLVALLGIAFADLLMFMQLGFQTALYDSNTRLHRSLQADIVLISPQARNLPSLSTFSRRRLYQAMDIPGVNSAEPVYLNNTIWKNPLTRRETGVLVIGFNPDKPAFDLPDVNRQLEAIKLPGAALFDRGARGDYQQAIAQIEEGKIVTAEIERRTVIISGLFQVGASFGAEGNLITSDRGFLRLFSGRQSSSVSLGLIKVKPGYDPKKVAAMLKAYLRNDVRVLTHKEFIEFENNFWRTNSPIGFIFNLGVSMGFVVGIIIVYQVLSTDVNAHVREYATFKAMGYRNYYLLGVVFEESLILAVLGFFPGLAVSLGLYQLTRKVTNLPMYITVFRALQVLLLTIIMCVISGAIATRKLQATDPADMF